jgi:hypothetical protein
MKHDHCKWTATTTHGVDTVQLTVKGICQEPTPGYKLSLQRVDLKGGAPKHSLSCPPGHGPHRHRAGCHHADTRGIQTDFRLARSACA